jgi:YHS domain-containing protein
VLLLLRVILVIVLVRALWRFLRGVLEGAGYSRTAGSLPRGVTLVRDPVCGIFVSPKQALAAEASGETAYFCSEQCRRKWQEH